MVGIKFLFNYQSYLITMPLARAFLSTEVIPFLLMVLSAEVDTFKVIHVSSSGM